MTHRPPVRDDLAGGYVECTECGHPIENHGARTGCDDIGGECPCNVDWTRDDIRRVRREEGLPARWNPNSL